MANRRFIDFPIASTVGDSDIILIWQSGANKQTTKATFLSGLPENLDELNDVAISGLTNGQILRYDSVTGKWENTDQGNLDLNDLNDVSIVSPSNGQVLVYNSSTSKWENSSGGYVPYTGAVTTVNLGAQTIQAGQFVKAGGTAAQFLKADGSVDSNVYGTGTVTSVGLTMPSAFNVANSPITTAGTLAVTGAGTAGQYIRGDGSLADFPQASGGGSSVNYYLNGSISQGTIGGVAYKELNKVPILGSGTQFSINADGYIASFLTDAGDPNLLEIAGGNWNFETYFSASSSGGTPTFYVELYKYDGTTFTLIASSSTSPELIAFGTNLNPYFSTLAVPTTTLALTDRLAVRFYVTHSGRTITMHTENNTLCQIVTTFTTGLTSLNGLTAQVQNLAVGTSGTDFNIASATATHTFNLPTASATNRGALSSADWTTFNNKQNALTNPVTGTGTSGQIAYFSGTSTITSESGLVWDATNNNLSIGGATANSNLTVNGSDNTNIFTVLAGTNSRLHVGTLTTGTLVYLRSQNNYGLNLGVNNTDYLTISNAGNSSFFGNITLANGANRFVRIGSASNYYYDLQTTGDDFQIIEAGATPRLTFTYPTGAAKFSSSLGVGNATSTNGFLEVWKSGSSIAQLSIGQNSTYHTDFFVDTTGNFYLQPQGTTRLTITSSGNVGIGVTPNSWGGTNVKALEVYLASMSASLTYGTAFTFNTFYDTAGNWKYIGPYTAGKYEIGGDEHIWYNAPSGSAGATATFTPRMKITSSGNVGIGNVNPDNFNGLTFATPILDVSGSIQIKGIAANGVAALQFGGETYRKALIYSSIAADTPYLAFGIASSGSSSSASEVMRINSSGFLKASNTGTYASSTGTYHELMSNQSGNNITYLWNTSASPYGPYVRFSGAAPNNGTNYYFYCDDTSAARFIVYSNGGISNYQANNTNLSDERTKKEIAPLESYWDKFKAIEIVKFKYKDQTHDDFNIGVIAQQVEKVAPEFVDVDGWDNKTEGNEVVSQEEPIKSIYTADLHHATIKVLQEAMAKIEEMQKEIDTLKN